jgi:hypothetical protein
MFVEVLPLKERKNQAAIQLPVLSTYSIKTNDLFTFVVFPYL